MSDLKFSIIKATSEDAGEILGWQRCSLFGYKQLEGKEAAVGIEDVKNETQTATQGIGHSSGAKQPFDLGSIIVNDSARMQIERMSDKRYIYLNSLVTDPSHQGQSIGSALVHWATSKADADRVPYWLQSSPVAHGVYANAGFKDAGRLDIDLSKFAPGGKKGQRGWKVYEFRHMLRLPQTTSGAS